MKKLKSFLCGALAFVAGSVVLSACGTNTKTEEPVQQEEQQKINQKENTNEQQENQQNGASNENTDESKAEATTTIPLTEAKEIIVNALAIDSSLSPQADETTGNRDIMEKLGRFTIQEDTLHTIAETGEKFMEDHTNGTIVYRDYQIDTLLETTTEVDYVRFNIGRTYVTHDYVSDNVGYCQNGYQDEDEFGVSGRSAGYYNEQLAMLKATFGDEAFTYVYERQAVKEINEQGYSLTLQGDFRSFNFYWYLLSGMPVEDFDKNVWLPYEQQMLQRYAQEVLDTCHMKVTVNFNNDNEITGAVVDILGVSPYDEADGGYNVLTGSVYTITKTDAVIEEPEWVTAYKTSQA